MAYIAGVTAPPGKRMGHAGAIIEGDSGTAESKINALEAAGVQVAKTPSEIAKIAKKIM
ncbi:MAG: Succinyl-CoA ligase (ADP-forming) subunit alpha [Methanobacterium sp. PtaU1.Bin242]|nr:MAG: Succinyl-CoA ligase (ADP-forming) subunit alpha [Methanobacterium sp. PtaU1.Bin242]